MAQSYLSPYGFGAIYTDDETDYLGDEIERLHTVTNKQLSLLASAFGFGVLPSITNGFNVTAGTGLNVNVGAGLAIVGTLDSPCVVRQPDSVPRLLEANHDSSDPIYLHVQKYDGTGANDDSFARGLPSYYPSDLESIPGAVLLATITTSASAVLTVTPNPNRFIQIGGTSLAPAQQQTFTLEASGSGPFTFHGPSGDASITPGDDLSDITDELAIAWGLTSGQLGIVENENAVGTGGNIATGGTAIDSSHAGFVDTYPANAFDNETSGTTLCWWCSSLPGYVGYDLGSGESAVVTSYEIFPRSGSSGGYAALAPQDFTLDGSNNGTTWTTLDTRTGIVGWSDGVKKTFTFSNSTPYRFHRLRVTQGGENTVTPGDHSNVMLAELRLNQDGTVGAVELVITNLTENPLDKLTTSVSAAEFLELHPASEEGPTASESTVEQVYTTLQRALAGMKGVEPIPVHQVGHGFTAGNVPIRVTGDDTYALVGAGHFDNVVGKIISIEGVDDFTFQAVGPLIKADYSATHGPQYAYAGGGSNTIPGTAGAEYVMWGIALNSDDIVLVSRPSQLVPGGGRRSVTTSQTMLASDRDITMISTTSKTLTLRSTAEMHATGADYTFTYCSNGAGSGQTLTLQADGSVIYDLGGEVSSYPVNDAETIVLAPYMRADSTPGLRIKSSS